MSEFYQRVSSSDPQARNDYLPTGNELMYINVLDDNPGITKAQYFAQYLVGLISSLLLLRFLLALFGANELNGLVSFLYSLTSPLTTTFHGLFSIDTQYGVARFEVETLVAIIVYILAGLGIMRLLDVFRSK
ncbi:MAG: YggT family protein [bacterium]|nr:YggT family protein [bacterium]